VDDTAQAATGVVVAVAAVTVVGVVAIAFLIGKRKGRKKTTVVEIRRV
jgi:predicted ATP-grasp superfamily ATP-dependent carboligase